MAIRYVDDLNGEEITGDHWFAVSAETWDIDPTRDPKIQAHRKEKHFATFENALTFVRKHFHEHTSEGSVTGLWDKHTPVSRVPVAIFQYFYQIPRSDD